MGKNPIRIYSVLAPQLSGLIFFTPPMRTCNFFYIVTCYITTHNLKLGGVKTLFFGGGGTE